MGSCFCDFGAAPFIYGTLVTSVVALAIAVPLGLAPATFWPNWPLAN